MERKHEFDFLRVFVFALLIFYHVGMFYVPWEWHLNNEVTYRWLQYPMAFLNQWRIPLLFAISGIGTYLAFGKRSPHQYRKERLKRLGLPLIAGMLLIVPPQVYMERLYNNQYTGNYFSYIKEAAFVGVYPTGNVSWHHLWFLPYLLIFSLIASPLFFRIYQKEIDDQLWSKLFNGRIKIFWCAIPFFLADLLLEPFFNETKALVGDWYALVKYSSFFICGFYIMAGRKVVFPILKNHFSFLVYLGLITFMIRAYFWYQEDGLLVHILESAITALNTWAWIYVLIGYAIKYRYKGSPQLSYANKAVYPFYILHQTITILLAYCVLQVEWNAWIEALLLTIGTFGISWIVYELIIRKIPFLYPFFGLKTKKEKHLS